jgi:hypothetical protein
MDNKHEDWNLAGNEGTFFNLRSERCMRTDSLCEATLMLGVTHGDIDLC